MTDLQVKTALFNRVQALQVLKAAAEGREAGTLFAAREADYKGKMGYWRIKSIPESIAFKRKAEALQERIWALKDAIVAFNGDIKIPKR